MQIKTKSTPDGYTYMDIISLRNLDASFSNFHKNKNDANARQLYFNHFLEFLDFSISYATDVFKGKTYTYDHIIPQLFVTQIKTGNQYKQYLRYALYAGMLYAQKLKEQIKISDLDNLDDLKHTVSSDYEWLIFQYENIVLNHSVTKLMHGSRPDLNVMDIKWGANQLMFAEFTGNLSSFDYRNTKPYVMFMVRQCLEILGKNMIGFVSINDKHGNPIHQFTQVAWTFLAEMEKQGKNLISLPIKASSIFKLNSWTNSFVHTTFCYNCYTQFFALETLYEFSCPVKHNVQTFNGLRSSTLYGDYRINDYSKLKQEFEAYVVAQHNGYPVQIEWMDPENVGAYIINMNNEENKKNCLLSSILDSILRYVKCK